MIAVPTRERPSRGAQPGDHQPWKNGTTPSRCEDGL